MKRAREYHDDMLKPKENRHMGPAVTGANATEVKRLKLDTMQ